MIDIIIPTFNDGENLYKTLLSIGGFVKSHIIIVDDCSEKEFDFEGLKKAFEPVFDISAVRSKTNLGPGGARNLGLEHAQNEFVMFLDCGDVLSSPFILKRMINTISENREAVMISPAALEEKDGEFFTVGPKNNRCHGKIYRRAFLNEYGIRFNEDYGRINEDIGFNMLCRLVCRDKVKDAAAIYETDEIGAVQTEGDKSSVTRRNGYEFSFRQTNLGTAKNAVYAFKRASELGVSEKAIDEIGYNVICFLYTSFIKTLNMRPEFEQKSFFGALYFYHYYFGRLKEIDQKLLLDNYNAEMAAVYGGDSWFRGKITSMGFLEFLNRLEALDKMTDWEEEDI